jgi:hypothetical protein
MIRDVKRIAVLGLVLLLAGCFAYRTKEQRTTEGPMAEDIWTMKVLVANGREPNFDERRRWDNAMEQKIGQYLRQNPEAANSVDVSTFVHQAGDGRPDRRASRDPPGPAARQISDPAEMEARPSVLAGGEGERADRGVDAPSGWFIYMKDRTVVDITQYAVRPDAASRREFQSSPAWSSRRRRRRPARHGGRGAPDQGAGRRILGAAATRSTPR